MGDLRAVNNDFLDTYQLKSQNGVRGGTDGVDIMAHRVVKTAKGRLMLVPLKAQGTDPSRESVACVLSSVVALMNLTPSIDPFLKVARWT